MYHPIMVQRYNIRHQRTLHRLSANQTKNSYKKSQAHSCIMPERSTAQIMLTALSAIASEQSNQTENTMKKVKQFLDYAASQEYAVVTYKASDMQLAIHRDASYFSEPKSRSRPGGHHFRTQKEDITNVDTGAVLNLSQVIKTVMSSAAEAAKLAVPIRHTLEEMGHPQGKTPIQTDNFSNTSYKHETSNFIKAKCPRKTKTEAKVFIKSSCGEMPVSYYWQFTKDNLSYDIK